MSAYQRPAAKRLLDRLRAKPGRLIIVTGPRQTGKTTVVDQVLGEIRRPAVRVAVDEPDPAIFRGLPEMAVRHRVTWTDASVRPVDQRDTRWLVRKWEQARRAASESDRGCVLAVDEIQEIPNWYETAKGLWDSDRRRRLRLHVVLVGPTPRARHCEVIHVEQWSFVEMAAAFDFDLDRYVYFGGYPGVATLIGDEARWRSFIRRSLVEATIERDILALQRVDKPYLLKQLFVLGAESSGQILSYNRMLGQLDDAGNTTTLTRYLNLLSSTGLIAGLAKYSGRARRRRASSPKLNVLGSALMSAHSDYTFEQARADRTFWGHLVESAVGAHLLSTCGSACRVFYWRDRGQQVDFILEHGRRLVAFEVNAGARRRKVSGLGVFGESFPVSTSHVVGRGGIPVAEFLQTPAREWFEGP